MRKRVLHFIGRIVWLHKIAMLAAVWASVGLLTVMSIAGYFGQLGQFFENASHLRIPYAVGFFFCVSVFILYKCWRQSLATVLIFLLVDFAPLAQLYVPPAKTTAQSPHSVTVFHANLWGGRNHKYETTVKAIKVKNPDIVGLSEVTPVWARVMKEGLKDYPYQVIETRFGGVALFSRYPISSSKVDYYGSRSRPRITAKIKVAESELTCVLIHPVIPLGNCFSMRNGELEVIGNQVAGINGAKIVFGDFNCSPWSSYFSALEEKGKLKDSELGFGPQPSWHTQLPYALIPIDHCLISENMNTLARSVGPNIGSDHLPFVVKFSMPIN